MSTSRGEIKEEQQSKDGASSSASSSTIFSKLPPKARPIKNLNFPKKDQEDNEKRNSFHVVYTAEKKLDEQKTNKSYFFKVNPLNSVMSELEALSNAFYRLIAPSVASNTCAYYDPEKGNQFAGVTSKKIPGFVPNKEKPLEKKDIVIELTEIINEKELNDFFEQHRNQLNGIMDDLIPCLNRDNTGYIRNFFNYYCTSSPTAIKLEGELKEFRKPETPLTQKSVENLIAVLSTRRSHLNTEKKDQQTEYKTEVDLLEKGIQTAKEVLAKIPEKIVEHKAILHLEEIDHRIEMQELNGTFNLADKNDAEQITEIINGKSVTIKVIDLKNYRTVRKLAEGLTTSYIFNEGDLHNRNIAADGSRIDFDMSLWDILYEFKDINFLDSWLRTPNTETFKVTARDIRCFPNLIDARPYYWPTKQTIVNDSTINKLSYLYDFSKNYFSAQDNEVFKQLSTHPVFIFHKFKTLLKYILTNEQMYRQMSRLHIREDLTFPEKSPRKDKKVIDEIIKSQMARIQAFKNTLMMMPEFQEFLDQYGSEVFKMIENEFKEYKTKLETKVEKKSYYKDLIKTIDLGECDLYCLRALPEQLDQLEGKANSAYIIVDNKLYYISKLENERTEIKISVDNLNYFKETYWLPPLTPEKPTYLVEGLSEKTLESIEALTSHKHEGHIKKLFNEIKNNCHDDQKKREEIKEFEIESSIVLSSPTAVTKV